MNAIREMRKSLGYTQHQLSLKSGVSRPVIARLESGKALYECRVDTLIKLTKAFGCTLEYLLDKQDAS